MSLDVLAQHLASKGRNGDSMLVHMTPGEVHGLHALALAHGGKLTINPDTGLPEANFLKKLLPMIAGAALNFFAPGIGTAIGSALGGLSGAAGSAIAVGGITGLATGSLQKGLMAGLGAYGGAGLAEGLSALGAQGAASQLAEQGIAAGAQENARDALLARVAEQTAIPTGLEAAKAGLSAAAKNPSSLISALGGGKQALQYAAMAAAPIMADQAVPTVTKSPGETGYIRPFVYDAATFGQGPQGLQALAPIPANQISYGPPPGGANGGLVALANGGWTGDIPGPEDSRRKEFEQYLASSMSPQAYQEVSSSPFSVARPDFAASVAAHRTGLRSLQDQGITSVFGKDFASYGRTPEDVRAWNQALMTERPMGGHIQGDTDLNQLLDNYMGAVKSGDARQAIRSMSRMNALGLSPKDARAMATTLDPEFESTAYQQYAKAGKSQFGSGAFLTGIGESYFSPGSSGWSLVSYDKALFGLSDEDIAYGLGMSEDEVKRSLMGAKQWELNAEGRPIEKARPVPAPTPAPEPPPASETPALDYLTGRTPDTGTVAPPAPTPAPRAETPYPEPSPTPAPSAGGVTTPTTPTTPTFTLPTDQQTRTVPEATVTPGGITGGGVETFRTPTTPTFQLPPEEQIFKTPVGTITGGTVTGTVDTKEALREYERTAPTGKPPAITSDSTLLGYKGQDKTYGGVEKPYVMPTPAALGTAGSISRGTETMDDVRRLTGNRYDQAPSTFTPSISGASKSAYDFLMGKGAYPTDQFDRTEVGPIRPLWRPYVQGVAGAADAFAPRTTAPTAQFGFKPPTVGTPTTGTQRWKNTKTGEIYLAPAGYAPPSNDWVLDTQNNALDPALQGGGDDAGAGVGSGTASDGGSADGDGSGVGDGTGGVYASGGLMKLAMGGYAQGGYNLGSYSDGGRLLRGPGDGVSDDIPATIGDGQPARLADGEFVVPARIVSELGNGSTEAGARQLYAMMDRVQRARNRTVGKDQVAANTNAARFLPA